jgi:hypothetical protein
VVGNLSTAGESNWFSVSFPDNTNTSYHPKITISGTDVTGGTIKFTVYNTTACPGPSILCLPPGGDDSTNAAVTTWETSYTAGDPVSYPVTGSHFDPIPLPGGSGNVLIEVFRTSGNPTCNAYTLTISD